MRALGLLRVLVGPVVLMHLRPFLAEALDGRIYRDAFYEPYAAWYPRAARHAVRRPAVARRRSAAVAMSLGFLTRLATATTFAVVTYNLFLSTTHFHNNRAYLVIVLGLLAVAPCGRELSLDAWLRRRAGAAGARPAGAGLAAVAAAVRGAAVYAASGLSKLLDRDWFGGTVTWQRVVRARASSWRRRRCPDWAVSLLTDRSFHTVAAKLIVLTELFIAAGLWWRGTRYAAVWVAVVLPRRHRGLGGSAGLLVPRRSPRW